MAKGDKKKVESSVNQAVGTSRQANDALTNQMIVPTTQNMYNTNQTATAQQMGDYRDLMDQFKNYQSTAPQWSPVSAERVNYNRTPEMEEAFGGYRNFMNTGGFSPQDIADMRARGVSPIRSTYANMVNELQRQKNLQGGYSPNMAAAMTRMRGSTSQQMADQVQNINAYLAEQIQKGKMFGTSGMGDLSTRDTDFAQRAALANQSAGLQAAGINASMAGRPDPRLQALQAASSLYSASPGLMGTTGNQLLNSTQNWLSANNQGQNVGQMGINGALAASQIPSNFEVGLGRVGQGIQLGGAIAGGLMGLPGGVQQPTKFGRQAIGQSPYGITNTAPYNW